MLQKRYRPGESIANRLRLGRFLQITMLGEDKRARQETQGPRLGLHSLGWASR